MGEVPLHTGQVQRCAECALYTGQVQQGGMRHLYKEVYERVLEIYPTSMSHPLQSKKGERFFLLKTYWSESTL